MKTITKKWLKKKGACSDGVKWFLSQEERNTAKVLLKLVEENRVDDALWVLENTMNKKQSAAFVAERSAAESAASSAALKEAQLKIIKEAIKIMGLNNDHNSIQR